MNRILNATLSLILFLLQVTTSAQFGNDYDSVSAVRITSTIRTYILAEPRANAPLVKAFVAGTEESAFGRDAEANWLRILDGWVLAEVFNTVGEVGVLPDVTDSINVTMASGAKRYSGPSAKWFDVLGEEINDSSAVAIGRNEDGSWIRLPQGWIEAVHVITASDIQSLPVSEAPGFVIRAKIRTFILEQPQLSAEFVDVFDAGEEALAVRRSGEWLQIARGWVSAEAVQLSSGEESARLSVEGVMVTKTGGNVQIRSGPSYVNTTTVGQLQRGQAVKAVGRNENGTWLQLTSGWTYAGDSQIRYVVSDGDIMSLPVTAPRDTSNYGGRFNIIRYSDSYCSFCDKLDGHDDPLPRLPAIRTTSASSISSFPAPQPPLNMTSNPGLLCPMSKSRTKSRSRLSVRFARASRYIVR